MKKKYIKNICILSLSAVVTAGALFFPKLSSADSERYVVNSRISVYTNAYDAKTRKNSTGKWGAGTYYVYRRFNGSINITDVQGEPGGWINPDENSQRSQNTQNNKKSVVYTSNQKVVVANNGKMSLTANTPVYISSYDAKNKVNQRGTFFPGDYYIYREYDGAFNLSKTKGEPGGWIYFDSSIKQSVSKPSKLPEVKETIKESKKNMEVHSNNKKVEVAKANEYVLKGDVRGFISSYDAVNGSNPVNTVRAGKYFVFSRYNGMINVTTSKDVPGSWINPNHVKVSNAKPAPKPAPKPESKKNKKKPEIDIVKPEEKYQTDVKNLSDEAMILVFKKNKKEIKAVDISEWNGDTIYWDKLKANDIKGVIVRGGYSTDIDANARKNIREALNHGLHVGAYWAMYPISEEEAVKEARTFNNLMSEFKGEIELPLFADFEYFSDKYANSQGVYLNKKTRTDIVIKFLETLKSYGWYVGNYANVDYMENYFEADRLEHYDLWLADWRINPSEKWLEKSGIHQYSSEGEKVGNGSTSTDMNKIFYDYPSIIKNLGFNGFIRNVDINKIKSHKPETPKAAKSKSVTDLAYEVLNNKWGVWPDRQVRLEKAGYNYHAIQDKVNEILGY
ncbi:GH25 family lysozyme [Helcococcus bovis]|uniref:GH25 family lysozyme n=1 Tax=Helcococcus bovis TaxID=3153252 RepID=UPI0038BBD310